jgi:pimeloyl-ACP methyl ester carboxylesterase
MITKHIQHIILFSVCIFTNLECIRLNDLLVFPSQFTKTDNYQLDTVFDGYVDSSNWDTITISKSNVSLNGLIIKSNKDTQNILSNYWVLYCDGNASNLVSTAISGKAIHKTGVNFLGFEYRGYGKSYGSVELNEKTIFTDANTALSYLNEDLGIKTENIIVMGFSIGTTAAIETSQWRQFAGVFLMASIASAEYLANQISGGFNVKSDWFTDSKLDNLSKIGNLKSPVCFVHGKKDGTIPYYSSIQLFEKAHDPKRIYLNDDDHNQLLWDDAYWLPLLKQFLESALVENKW